MNAFERQNLIGREAEMEVALAFFGAGWAVQWKNARERRDLVVWNGSGPELLEIKNESAFAGGANLCIELVQGYDNRPSGLAVSQSTVCIHYFGDYCWLYRTQAMRLFIRSRQFPVRPFGKSDNRNRGILLPTKELCDTAWAGECETAKLPEHHLFSD